MTPDRSDQTPKDSENGVLSDTGNLDTARLGFISGATAQVNVELPAESDDTDDDVVDDGVIDEGVPFVVEIPADAEAADADEPADVEAVLSRYDDVEDAVVVEAETGEIVVEFESADADDPDESHEDAAAAEAAEAEEIALAVAFAEAAARDQAAADAAEIEAAAAEAAEAAAKTAAAEAAAAEKQVEAEAAASVDEAAVAEPDATDADARDEVEAPAVAPVPPVTGTVPVSRREAFHPTSVADRAVERVQPRPEVTLTSKRLGEFEADRETADLLTPDRLLDPHHVVKSEPEGLWQQLVYSMSGHRINLGDGKRARARKELDRRIAAPLNGVARFVPVVSRKGGVGKTTVTTLLGMALADARDDRVIAIDANPDRGTLAERIARTSGKTVRDLVRVSGDVAGYNDLSNIVARDETRLDVLASDTDPRVSEAFNDVDYNTVASLAAHYYSIVLTDTGTGIVHSVMEATLQRADQLVVVAGLSVDEAKLASETLTWLETNGYAEQVRGAIVVVNNARPGAPLVRPEELEAHFKTRVRSVVHMPYDPHIAAGSAITFRDLQPQTRQAVRELAAVVVEGLRVFANAA